MKKILIIEDDQDTLEMLGVIVENSNFVAILRSCVLPLTEIEQISPDLIILDQWIGDSTGAELCLHLKENPATQAIPIVMMSAFVDIGQIAYENHADGSLAKPFDVAEVEGVLQAYIE